MRENKDRNATIGIYTNNFKDRNERRKRERKGRKGSQRVENNLNNTLIATCFLLEICPKKSIIMI